jgi:hypothetical protein
MIDLNSICDGKRHLNTLFSGFIEAIVNNMDCLEEDRNEINTNYHWLINQIFKIHNDWLVLFNEEEYFDKNSSYQNFICISYGNCFRELEKGLQNNKLSIDFCNEIYCNIFYDCFNAKLNSTLKDSVEENIIKNIPNEILNSTLKFALNHCLALQFDRFIEGSYHNGPYSNDDESLDRLRKFLIKNNKITS